MTDFYYDLHLHSCLSPCADNDMTPKNIAGMAYLKGLQIVALTDHNTCSNCPAFFKACKKYGIVPVAGMELTTAEEIHLICLFPTLKAAMKFDSVVRNHRTPIKNRPDIFGEQIIMDENDEITGYDVNLLSFATDLTLEDAYKAVDSFGGASYPAHIDREANGIIAILGSFPEEPAFSCVEIHDMTLVDALKKTNPIIKNKLVINSSDAHYLTDINEAVNSVALNCDISKANHIREKLVKNLIIKNNKVH
ncbi:MAG: hypothetical protein A2Y17_08300 [Clostridiales bacterium GWF2_38_85]|nr:MAG: hypothetical protein A2Y17_08300 [Clostridiales bacterium GWF2_38_85]HBL83806.1 phosphoesterase [Clostridiales bacterium]